MLVHGPFAATDSISSTAAAVRILHDGVRNVLERSSWASMGAVICKGFRSAIARWLCRHGNVRSRCSEPRRQIEDDEIAESSDFQ
ncbi:MAG: hypothetical protein C4293_20230 [Nitrospiraceae bacterium]